MEEEREGWRERHRKRMEGRVIWCMDVSALRHGVDALMMYECIDGLMEGWMSVLTDE